MRRWRAAWMGCAAALVVAACGGGSNTGGAKPPHGNTLIVGETGQPYSLDPGQSLGNYDLEVMFLIYDPLLRADPKTLKPQPGLATAWNWMGPDRLTLRLTLRQGVTFQDGTPFDAQAVKTSMDHYRSTHLETDLTPVSSVNVADTHTVDIHLSAPYSPLPEVLTERAGMIVSPAALQKYGPVNIGQHPVGTGPFKLDSWVQQQELKLTRWNGYWQKGKAKLAGIDWKVISDPTALASAIQAGQVDYSSNIQPTNRQALQQKSNLATKVIPTLSMALIQLNTGLPPVNDALVREAIDSALDRKGINNVINGPGIGGPAWQYVPPTYWTYSKNL
ncbi:MAG: hypothetical protein J2P45_20960, partial [Candidatus Dormibacteraeota bacterium]|nr:hypothetical protein [Candidatus Dormibacteraeota bacterium]